MNEKSISVAVLLDSPYVQEWQLRALQAVTTSNRIDASVDLVIINSESHQSTFWSQLQSFVREFSVYKMLLVYRELLTTVQRKPWYRQLTPLEDSDIFADVETIECEPESADGVGNKLPDSTASYLTDVDIGIRFGFGILKGKALTGPEYGVLSYHHGDLTKYRGRPSGFYEFVHTQTTAGVTVQRLNETLDGGEIAAMSQVRIRSAKSWGEVQSRLFEMGIDLLPKAVYRCVYEPDEIKPPDTLGELYTTPNSHETIWYFAERIRRIIK